MPQQTDLRTAEDNVHQGEINVACQQGIIDLKRRRRQDTELSELILQTLEDSLALHRAHLGQLQTAQS